MAKGVELPQEPPRNYRETVKLRERPDGEVFTWCIEDSSGYQLRLVAKGEIPVAPDEPTSRQMELIGRLIDTVETWDRARILVQKQ